MGNILTTYHRQTGAAALLLVFLFYMGNIFLFTHIHNIDGIIVSHSHFYSGTTDTPNHNHSEQQINVIHILSSFNSDALCVDNALAAYTYLIDTIYQRVVCRISDASRIFLSLRAPPVMA